MPSTVKPTSDVLARALGERAAELGFDWFGIARAEPLVEELARLDAWIAKGRHGQMAWLARETARRCDPGKVLAGCRSVVVVGRNYQVAEESERRDPPPAGKVSRYARGRDYHRVLDKPLRKLARFLDREGPEGTRSRAYVDHGPVLERAWAARAGLGFIGKHTLLIHPEHGSWHFLGVVLTTAELPPSLPLPSSDGCGDCRRCLDICPTGALDEPYRIDARRCISYLTIEHEGEIDAELAARMDGWVFGCDACQEVCPYNRKRARPAGGDPFGPRLVPAAWSLAEMFALREEDLAGRLAQSPVRRAGAESLHRNAHLAQKNEGQDFQK